MDLIFCGTPEFAVPTLRALAAAGHNLRAVLTQPDKPKGRGLEFAPTPVKQAALQLGIPVRQPDKIKNNEELRLFLVEQSPQVIVVVGYGRIIPQWMIDLPRLGNINLHASLLPRYRGAAPIQWAIAMGETVTGNTTMRIDAGLDTGHILLQRTEPIYPDDTALTLAPRLAAMGAQLMVETLRALEQGTITPRPQDHAQHTLAPILTREDGFADFSRPARDLCNRLRGFQPWPGVYTTFRGKNLVLHAVRAVEPANIPAGELRAEGERLLVGCGQNSALELLEVQLEGKKRTSAGDFLHGYRINVGERLG